jgi:SpoVK/Ycf46/Vps4 family AAA+-type ATPase
LVSELESIAFKYAQEAVRNEREGLRDKAIENYSRAVEVLLKLVKLYPDYPLNKVYMEKISNYQQRIRLLQMGLPFEGLSASDSNVKAEVLEVPGASREERPNVSWSDVIGLEHVKEELRKAIILPTRVDPEKLPLGWPTGILLFGPPGCGKTLVVAAVATEVNAHLLYVDPALIMSKWLGESEKNVAKVFEEARRKASRSRPAIIFIDEVEALTAVFSTEVGGEARMRSQLLNEMDGLRSKGKRLYLYVVGATNKPWMLDQAFLRRFQKRIYVPPPDFKARVELFKHYTRGLKLANDVDFEVLAQRTEGYTAHDIEEICREVQFKLVEDLDPVRGELREACMRDFLNVLSKRRPSVSKELIRKYVEWDEKYGAA